MNSGPRYSDALLPLSNGKHKLKMSSTYNELEFARKITERKQSVLPIPKPGIIINGKKYNGKQPCILWKERISKLATDQELESWFNGEHKNNVAIIIEKSSFAIDIDGLKSKDLFWNKLVPRLSEELQNAIRNTMCTKTGGGGEHVLFEIKPEEFPDGISTKTYVSFSEHDEIKIKGNPSYLVERGLHETGNKYETIRDVENLVILSKDCAQELIKALQNLKLETDAIKTIVGALTPYYIKGKRDEIVFALSGYLHKSGTPESFACEIVAQLALETNDEEIKNRLQVVKETCKKPANSKEVSGSKRLNDVLQASKPSSGKSSGALDHVNTIADMERALVNLSLQEKTFKFKPKKDDDDEDHQEDQKSKTQHVVYKYSKDGISSLAEEVIIGNEVRFLQIEDDEPIIRENIDLTEEKNIILKPHKSSNDDQTLATIVLPYSFKNEDEIRYFIKIAKQKTIYDLFYMSESLWKKFLVARDGNVITFYTIDTIYSYFQDLFPTTHYEFWLIIKDIIYKSRFCSIAAVNKVRVMQLHKTL
jgi:Bifunctional DNA primase/polymerase, N-terminal